LKIAREARKLTQEELALRTGLVVSQMNRYEKGKSDPSADALARVAKELEVTTDWLLGLVEMPSHHLEEKDISATERKLLAAFRDGRLAEMLRIISEKADAQPPNQVDTPIPKPSAQREAT
jgi:transcriptional regulator with XRE-family HTH domain